MTKVVDTITGGDAARRAANDAAGKQTEAGNRAIAVTEEGKKQARADYQPYADLGTRNIAGLESLTNDPNAQLNFIQQNPFFKALTDQAANTTFANRAAGGKVGSGDTAKSLQDQFLLLGNDLVQQQIGNKTNLVNLGYGATQGQANASLGAANTIADLNTQIGNSQAAGLVGGANAIASGRQTLIKAIASAGGAAAGAGAGGAGAGGAAACDRRFKENIKEVGKLHNGLPLYLFNYKGDHKLHINVMAQDVEKVNPDAVTEIDGYKYVNMEKVCL